FSPVRSVFFSCARAACGLCSFPTRRPSDLGRRGPGPADPLQVEVPDEADDRTDEHLHTADDEQPGARIGQGLGEEHEAADEEPQDRKSTRLNSSHASNSYAVFCSKIPIYMC